MLDDNNNKIGFWDIFRKNLFQFLALGVAVFNLWLATKLAPISQDIKLIDARVSAVELLDPASAKQLDEICRRLERLEDKLDNYIFKNN